MAVSVKGEFSGLAISCSVKLENKVETVGRSPYENYPKALFPKEKTFT